MVKKILGYLLALIGIFSIAITSIEQIRAPITPYLPIELTNDYLLIGGIALTVIGIFLIIKSPKHSKNNKSVELPIFHGKNIIGYRKT